MSGGEVIPLTGKDLKLVKDLIEHCIQLYKSRKETVKLLSSQANVVPGITELVWQRLEEENQEFFKVYRIRLALKEQILHFNEMLENHAALMQQIQSTEVAPLPVPDGSWVAQFQQNAGCYSIDPTGPSTWPESLQSTITPSLPCSFANGVSPLQTNRDFDLSTPSTIDCLPDPLQVQASDSMRLMQGLNEEMVKSESDCPPSQINYDADLSVGDAHGPMEDALVASCSGMETISQSFNEMLLGTEGSLFEHIPKTFSFPDFSAYPDIAENYQCPAFITTETNYFLDSQDWGEIPEENKVALSRHYSNYEEFGGE